MSRRAGIAKVELTDHMIRKMAVEIWTDFPDAKAPGLSLRVTPAGSKTWAVRGTAADGAKQRLTIGTYLGMSLRDARVGAAAVLAEIRAAAGNLNAAKRDAATARSGDPTLGELMAEYEAGPAPTRPSGSGRSEASIQKPVNALRRSLLACLMFGYPAAHAVPR